METNFEKLSIEPVKESELKTIFEIDQELFACDFYSFENWTNMYHNPHYEIKVLKYNHLIVGFLCLLNNVDEVEIIRIGIKKDYQGKHFGSYLLNYALQIPKTLLLEVSSNNPRAIQLYTKVGFVEIARRVQYYQDGSDAIIMQKRFSNY